MLFKSKYLANIHLCFLFLEIYFSDFKQKFVVNPTFISPNFPVPSQVLNPMPISSNLPPYSSIKAKEKNETDTKHRIETVEKPKIRKDSSNIQPELLTSSANSFNLQLNTKIANAKTDPRRIRATSESSTESNLSASLNSNSNLLTVYRNYKNYKPHLISNLRRLTNERIMLTSNNAPVSVFSRLAFRSSAFKYEKLFDKNF